jgi:Rrf2 family iron-sulfur cluster assembly transcriptional regulator
MLSNASKYGIRAVLFLSSKATKQEKIGAKQLASTLQIPAPFLAKTLQILTKNNIISSIKGPHGGFYLSKENKEKSIFDIIDCIDDVGKFNQCYLGHLECDEKNPCVVHHLYYPFKNELLKKLKTKTISEMAAELDLNANLNEIF